MSTITAAQITRLQIVYMQWAKRSLDVDGSRESRLAWAGEQLGRTVTSFSELSKAEARKLIDLLRGALGIQSKRKPRTPRFRNDATARAAGTEGRHDGEAGVRTMATQEDLDRIQDAITRLGWTREQFDSWLRSERSPLARKRGGVRVAPTDPKIKTWWEANRVWWALKSMLKSRGLWRG